MEGRRGAPGLDNLTGNPRDGQGSVGGGFSRAKMEGEEEERPCNLQQFYTQDQNRVGRYWGKLYGPVALQKLNI